ncbi:hypothetical protein FZEAL_8508 [Fusarium zealandicum]|uniref:Choline monooxygenase, chloroplastic n=1 Tax=Fusarium zealandicum TaxID=1053134 RepID=A0A8H4UE07_9HYPO|nr:hypothetical protein FZEAL_8508 [Fusarium zealandicum]
MSISFLKKYFATPAAPPQKEGKSTVRALPASWYNSMDIYQLERRAIFSKKWLTTTHKIRIPNAGDWVKHEVANFEFIVMRDAQDRIQAFHNVCTQSGLPIVTEDLGNAFDFTCECHNISYTPSGKIIPDTAEGLLGIHVHVDRNGFVWINMDAGEEPEIAWEDDFKGIDEQPRYEHYNFNDYTFDHTWEMIGDYNWKALADNYNECYHCQVAHPDIPTIADLSTYYVTTDSSYIQHFGNPTPEQIAKGFRVAPTYYWPNASTNVSPHFFFIQKFLPRGPTKSIMRYEVYRSKNTTDADFTIINDMYKRIMSEDKVLCAKAQKNLNAGVFVNGEMHPEMEKGPLFFQKRVRENLQIHSKMEQAAGKIISPAQRKLPQAPAAASESCQQEADESKQSGVATQAMGITA